MKDKTLFAVEKAKSQEISIFLASQRKIDFSRPELPI